MLLYRELFRRLKGSFFPPWSYRACCGLLVLLDISAFVGLIWYFLLRRIAPVDPILLTQIATGYLLLVIILIFISIFYGKLMSVRVATMFYLSIGLFFLVTGIQSGRGLDFPVWPWIIVWLVTLWVLLMHFAKEFASGEKENPQD
ncbi:MAG TPA: hypothetical protein ENN67_05920 [Firmicutes bacterium]|nr:hypothetical protein [Bacillota bacterium]